MPVNASLMSAAALRQQTVRLSRIGEVFLIGTAEGEGVKAQPPTLEVSGDRLTFDYAAPAILEGPDGRSLRNLELTLQVRHAPGQTLPEPETAAPSAVIPPLLAPWLN